MVFLGKNYKYFIGCKDDNHKIKPLCKGIQKRVKSYDREPKWMYFYKKINYQKDTTVFGIKSAKVLRKNLIANQSTIKKFSKPN